MTRRRPRPFAGCALALLLCARAGAAGQLQIEGEVQGITIDGRDDRLAGGTIVVGGRRIVVPPGVLVEFPGAALTLGELFARAPKPCRDAGVAGLVSTDACRRPPRDPAAHTWSPADDRTPRTTLDPEPTDTPPTTKARVVVAAAEDSGGGKPRGDPVATQIVVFRDDRSLNGAVTFVSEAGGYLRVGGAFGIDAGGAVLRINDPDARQSAQSGIGCGGEGNCSPDARFRADAVHYSVRFDAGYPACVPGGLGDVCAASSRPIRGIGDAARLVPIRAGDHVTALGAFEVVDGTRIFSAHTLVDHTSPLASREN
jgi:hypothetical protein